MPTVKKPNVNQVDRVKEAAVPNLGYAYPKGYVKNLRGTPDFHQFKNHAKYYNEIVTMPSDNSLGGTRVLVFSAWGYAIRKRLGTAGVKDVLNYVPILLSSLFIAIFLRLHAPKSSLAH